jgi:hypothetical protein
VNNKCTTIIVPEILTTRKPINAISHNTFNVRKPTFAFSEPMALLLLLLLPIWTNLKAWLVNPSVVGSRMDMISFGNPS